MPIAFALLAAAATTTAPPPPVLQTEVVSLACDADCTAPRRSRYRLDPQSTLRYDLKAWSVAEDGRPCPLMGPTICPHHERTIYATQLQR